jgi:hypothetical protein
MSASPEQLHEMLMYCINFARTMLADAGDFYPFGATLSPLGTVSAVGGYDGEERPKPQEIYQLLGNAFISGAREGTYLGVALAANVNIPGQYAPPSPDGLRVHLESDGYSRFMYVPYRLKKEGFFKKRTVVEFSEPFAVEIAPTFFSGTTGA